MRKMAGSAPEFKSQGNSGTSFRRRFRAQARFALAIAGRPTYDRMRDIPATKTGSNPLGSKGGSELRQDDFREQIAAVIADLGAAERTDRARLYRFARGLLRLAMTDLSAPRDRRGRTQSLLEFEAAVRAIEQGYATRDKPRPDVPRAAIPFSASATSGPAPWPGPGRVLATLITRNIRTMLAKDPLGYLWLFLAPILTIAVHFWAYTFLLGFGSVLDMPTLPFLILGIGGWHMMRSMTLKLGYELARDRNLVRLEPIDTLAVAAAKALELAFSYTAVVAAALAWLAFTGGDPAPRNLLGVAYYWSLLAISGVGLGLLLNLCRHYLPGVSLLAMPVFRIGFFFSGVVVVSEQFPERVRALLLWNPVLHIMQLLRTDYFVQYRSVDAVPAVAGFFALTILFLGCAAELSRRRAAVTA
jgi:capsular polysaccharide transport system permease protein